MLRIGLDIGSTTVKLVAVDSDNKIVFTRYGRHNTQMLDVVTLFLEELQAEHPDERVSFRVTGSVGMGFTERYDIPFVQEVVAASKAVGANDIEVATMIDIGGEDAKIVLFRDGVAEDLRMNGNCAGGTGAFIDQMAIILGVSVDELGDLALRATQIYPIASRCGVFCKTDIQNLIAKNVSRENIAASIFRAVAVQTITTLAHGYDIRPPVLFCGGPLTFIPALRNAFKSYLSLDDRDILVPLHGELMPAYGTALATIENEQWLTIEEILSLLKTPPRCSCVVDSELAPIFDSELQYSKWQREISRYNIPSAEFVEGLQDVFIGIDSGSTTTKIVVLNTEAKILYSFYKNSGGNPIETVIEGLTMLQEKCRESGTTLHFKGGCSTGYGEDLIKASFNLSSGIVETIAHYKAAHYLDPEVSFILDIGGQDMKAIFVDKGVINRIEINEACSSGCGSFIETFARSLGFSAAEFAEKACLSTAPAQLGTRCTVFMNSKVKQVLREGASVNDISAGLAYSVVRNCLFKVLKLKNTAILGNHIVVQGGTMRNDAVVRVLELLTCAKVSRSNAPELMGAFGCALYAMEHPNSTTTLDDMLSTARYTSRSIQCRGCENNCAVQQYNFGSGRHYYSGNRCEKLFTNKGAKSKVGHNMYKVKESLLFSRSKQVPNAKLTIGIPRILNMYEEYPFWHTLFTECGIDVILSAPSNFAAYEQDLRLVMSDNICFPAKLVHSHITDLVARGVDRIFMPFVLYEPSGEKEQNSYNCPIVTGYSAVIKSVQQTSTPIDTPAISFKDGNLLYKQIDEYLHSLGIKRGVILDAYVLAEEEQMRYIEQLVAQNRQVLADARRDGEMSILLAGRPYHTDPLIQHKVSDMLAEMGINVLTDDVARGENIDIAETHFLSQWAYPNRIMKAAMWATTQSDLVQFVEMTSFGCGPDAFIVDEVRDVLLRHHKSFTLLKLDDINNIGSMRLRVRSLVDSLAMMASNNVIGKEPMPFCTTPIYDKKYRGRKIIIPFFTPAISPLLPSIMRVAGYDAVGLVMSDKESADWGLKYANNEVCYPATLVVGDIIKAFRSGKYDSSKSVVCITQTGGQCRASNYLPILKKALIDAGYKDVPVISLTFGSGIENNQPALKINWAKMLPISLRAVLFSDCINKFYHASVARENRPGAAAELRDRYLRLGAELIENGRSSKLYKHLSIAAKEFNEICRNVECPKVGVVGEIYLKFNSFAQRNIVDWLTDQHIEVVPPVLVDFFTQAFVNRRVNIATHITKRGVADIAMDGLYHLVRNEINRVNRIGADFRYFVSFNDIFHEAERAKEIITLNAQFGEGWLLPAEIISYAESGVKSVISLQPFGCIANHIVSKGIEKRLKTLYPDLNLLSLDFDSGVSDVNIKNRLLLFIDKLFDV